MAKKLVKGMLRMGGIELSRYNRNASNYSKLYAKYREYTMIPERSFAANLDLVRHFKNLEGDYVECGVWRGGMTAAIAEIIGPNKTTHLFDSFEGLPPAKEIDGKAAIEWQKDTSSPNYFDNCKAEQSFAIKAMEIAKHPNFQLHPGWFDATVPTFKAPIGILRLDGDWYDSVMVCLRHLFPHVVPGGIVILDDYYTWAGCARAVHDYLSETKSPSVIHQWNNEVAYIVRKVE